MKKGDCHILRQPPFLKEFNLYEKVKSPDGARFVDSRKGIRNFHGIGNPGIERRILVGAPSYGGVGIAAFPHGGKGIEKKFPADLLAAVFIQNADETEKVPVTGIKAGKPDRLLAAVDCDKAGNRGIAYGFFKFIGPDVAEMGTDKGGKHPFIARHRPQNPDALLLESRGGSMNFGKFVKFYKHIKVTHGRFCTSWMIILCLHYTRRLIFAQGSLLPERIMILQRYRIFGIGLEQG